VTAICTRGRVPGDGAHLAFIEWVGTGEPIVALHGASSNAMFYVGVAERLAGRRPLLSLDLRGRGDADKPPPPYGMATHADDVAAAMRSRGIDRAVVVGHSMGASVATVLAQRHPDVCAGVVLYDGGLDVFKATARHPELARAFLASSQAIEGRMGRTFSSRAEYHDYWRGLNIFSASGWNSWVEAYLDDDLGGVEPDLRPKCTSEIALSDAQDLLATALADALEPMAAPVLALYADHGLTDDAPPLVIDEALEIMADRFPAFGARGLTDVNHYTIALADPGATATADALVAFADRCGM
jgi:pimeloyl-ACP methyl ester carboxylesterase